MSKLAVATREVTKGSVRYGLRVGRNAARSFVTISDVNGNAPFTVGDGDCRCDERASHTLTVEVHSDDEVRALASILRSAAALLERKESKQAHGRRVVRHG